MHTTRSPHVPARHWAAIGALVAGTVATALAVSAGSVQAADQACATLRTNNQSIGTDAFLSGSIDLLDGVSGLEASLIGENFVAGDTIVVTFPATDLDDPTFTLTINGNTVLTGSDPGPLSHTFAAPLTISSISVVFSGELGGRYELTCNSAPTPPDTTTGPTDTTPAPDTTGVGTGGPTTVFAPTLPATGRTTSGLVPWLVALTVVGVGLIGIARRPKATD